MIGKCFDEGTIQAFLDGELDRKRVERVTRHIALCDDCAVRIADAEAELAVTFTALDREFDTLVPTQRLWTKINRSIEAQNRHKSLWQSVLGFLTAPSSVAFASLLIVFGLFIGLFIIKNEVRDGGNNALVNPLPKNETVDVAVTESRDFLITAPPVAGQPAESTGRTEPAGAAQTNEFQVIRADVRRPVSDNNRTVGLRPKAENNADIEMPAPRIAEDSFIRTIKTLESSVEGRKDAVLAPSARFAFEKDMAVANATIDRLKDEVERNPNNKTARELLRNTYQTKISLLNSVAEKTELMASLN